VAAGSRQIPDRQRATAFARFFEAVHEGVYIGTIGRAPDATDGTTLAVNPHLKIMLGYPPETPEEDVVLFLPERFVDAAARTAFLTRLVNEGAVTDYLLRLTRSDGESVWV
jgi:PAS domain-containing protein